MNPTEFPEACRNDFPALQRRRGGKPPVYLDNACTTLVPRQVIEALQEYYAEYPACGGRRSHHWFAQEVTRRLEGDAERGVPGARREIADFIHARSAEEILFTLNSTHSVNAVARGLRFRPGDVVVTSGREHNSNLLPWLRLQKEGRIRVESLSSGERDDFDLDAFERVLKVNSVRLVSLAWTSNATGTTLPAKQIIASAHRYGARVLLDGAQTVPHQAVDAADLDVDFLAFSLHKMCGPRGVGVLYAREELLGRGDGEWEAGDGVIEPAILGGGNAVDSTHGSYRLLDGPERFEAGIQNYPGILASAEAVRYLRSVGMDRISARERELNGYLTEKLADRYGGERWLRILGPREAEKRAGILTFEVHRPNAVGIAEELSDRNNVMIRDGVFCVHSYFNDLYGQGWTRPKTHRDHRMVYRVSFYFYNTREECDVFLDTLDGIFRDRGYL